jgi:cobalt transporter subunit CbtB
MEHQTSNTATIEQVASVSKAISKPLQLTTVFFLGTVMLFGAGFVQTSAVHNAAHDVRHTLAFPCH